MADRFPDISNDRRGLYVAVRWLLKDRHGFDGNNNNFPTRPVLEVRPRPQQGLGHAFDSWPLAQWDDVIAAIAVRFAAAQPPVQRAAFVREIVDDMREVIQFTGVFGMLLADACTDPSLGRSPDRARPDDLRVTRAMARTDRDTFYARRNRAPNLNDQADVTELRNIGNELEVLIAPQFIKTVTRINEEYNAHRDLFLSAYPVFRGKVRQANGDHSLSARLFAEVVRRLVLTGTGANDELLELRISDSLSVAIGGKLESAASAIDIALPELDVGTVVEIIKDNVRAVGLIYFASQLEEMKLMAVADRVVDHFRTGMLPVSRGPGGDRIYKFLRDSDERFNEFERRGLYGRTFGLAQGAGNEVAPNREFSDLWIRFLSAVSTLHRQADGLDNLADVLRQQNNFAPATNRRYLAEQAHKSARDLAVNLSLHGYGIAHFAAVELKKLVADVVDMLSSAEVTSAYGVRDMWQLVERVSSLYLGGSTNGVRYRTTARAGADIIFWLGDQAQFLASVANPDPAHLIAMFDDAALLTPVERWLAVTGTAAPVVQQYSQPIDAPLQPTIPNLTPSAFIPESVRGVMNTVGNLTGNLTGGTLPGMNGVGVVPQA
jgi:hypothetical protein